MRQLPASAMMAVKMNCDLSSLCLVPRVPPPPLCYFRGGETLTGVERANSILGAVRAGSVCPIYTVLSKHDHY